MQEDHMGLLFLEQEPTPGTIAAMPSQERPYEKCLKMGPEVLTDAELLAVILRTSGKRGTSVLTLAQEVLKGKGNHEGLLGMYHLTIPELMQIPGIGSVKAVQLTCIGELARRMARMQACPDMVFQDAYSVASYYMEELRHKEQEVMKIMLLGSKGALLHEETISMGTVNTTCISPREIFILALKYLAVSVILVHNHPSGNPQPSSEDLEFTGLVVEAGHTVGIGLLDHIIVGDRTYFSLREEGLLQT